MNRGDHGPPTHHLLLLLVEAPLEALVDVVEDHPVDPEVVDPLPQRLVLHTKQQPKTLFEVYTQLSPTQSRILTVITDCNSL
jgi:hypothetical protein